MFLKDFRSLFLNPNVFFPASQRLSRNPDVNIVAVKCNYLQYSIAFNKNEQVHVSANNVKLLTF